MRLHRARAKWRAALVPAMLATQLGAPCQPQPQVPTNTLRFSDPEIVFVGQNYYSGSADILVDLTELVQAVDLKITWDPATLSVVQISPHAEFDDDGQLALPVEFDAQAGTATRIVDFRHGVAAQGLIRVATVYFEAPNGTPATLSVSGEVADPTGALSSFALGTPLSIP